MSEPKIAEKVNSGQWTMIGKFGWQGRLESEQCVAFKGSRNNMR